MVRAVTLPPENVGAGGAEGRHGGRARDQATSSYRSSEGRQMGASDMIAAEGSVIAQTYAPLPVVLTEGQRGLGA